MHTPQAKPARSKGRHATTALAVAILLGLLLGYLLIGGNLGILVQPFYPLTFSLLYFLLRMSLRAQPSAPAEVEGHRTRCLAWTFAACTFVVLTDLASTRLDLVPEQIGQAAAAAQIVAGFFLLATIWRTLAALRRGGEDPTGELPRVVLDSSIVASGLAVIVMIAAVFFRDSQLAMDIHIADDTVFYWRAAGALAAPAMVNLPRDAYEGFRDRPLVLLALPSWAAFFAALTSLYARRTGAGGAWGSRPGWSLSLAFFAPYSALIAIAIMISIREMRWGKTFDLLIFPVLVSVFLSLATVIALRRFVLRCQPLLSWPEFPFGLPPLRPFSATLMRIGLTAGFVGLLSIYFLKRTLT